MREFDVRAAEMCVGAPDPGGRGRERAVGNYALNYKYRQGGLRETDYMVAT